MKDQLEASSHTPEESGQSDAERARREKIAALKRAVDSGTYRVNKDEIVLSVIRDFSDSFI